jgi:hypothetical protein
MTAVMPMRFRATRQSAPRWLTVAWVELVLRLRDTNVPILAACMAAASVLLTPTIDASYAVITFGGLKPEMSAHTSLIAAGFVLSLLILPWRGLCTGTSAKHRRHAGGDAD